MNRNRYTGAAMKKEWTDLSCWYAKSRRLQKFSLPIELELTYFESNTKRDPDNITFAKKFILDGLKKAGVITDDSQKWIYSFRERWLYDGKTIGVHIKMKEVKNG
jgi:Holliday junction resolvase RusA-like endonuclease